MPNTRASDPSTGLHIVREIPLWAIICFLVGGIFTAGGVWWQWLDGVKRQDKTDDALQQIARQLSDVNSKLQATNLKDLEHDFKIDGLDKRVSKMETGK